MQILLIDIDSKIPNLALHKIAKYHTDLGDTIIWNNPLMQYTSDKIYVSCVFDWNKDKCIEWEGKAEIGGSGYSLKNILPEAIESIKPKINLGFTTRGCIRHCKFCIVPEKEGMVRAVADIYDIWDGKSKEIILLDNNILALPDHFFKIASQLKKEKLKVDFNQGLDHRLLTDEIAKELISLKHTHEIRFAFDDIGYTPSVVNALEILKNNNIKNWGTRWYIYVSPKDTFRTVMDRMVLLKEYKQATYVMRDSKIYNIPEFIALASWGNTMGAFKMNFKDVLNKSKRLSPYKKYFKEYLSN
jgi:hypothetical protein